MKIRISGADIECLHITTHINDITWDLREVRELLLPISCAEAAELFVDGAEWGYVSEYTEAVSDDNGEISIVLSESITDCSEYSIAGDITDHRDGTVSVRMGKPTATELELRDAKAALALLGVEIGGGTRHPRDLISAVKPSPCVFAGW